MSAQALTQPTDPPCDPAWRTERWASLRGLPRGESAPSELVGTVTRLAAAALRVPAALVCLAEADRPWCASCAGFEALQTSGDDSFWIHTMSGGRPLIVNDAAQDARFAGNPMVLGEPQIRAYLGVPLFSREGRAVGALSAIDRQSRVFGDGDLDRLRDFAGIVEELLVHDGLQAQLDLQTRRLHDSNQALHKQVRQSIDAARALSRSENRWRSVTNRLPAVIGYWNTELRCESANEGYREAYGLAPEAIVGSSMAELMGEALFTLNEPHARRALDGEPQRFERRIGKPDGSTVHYDIQYLPDLDETGCARGIFVIETDISALRRAQGALEASDTPSARDRIAEYLAGLAYRAPPGPRAA